MIFVGQMRFMLPTVRSWTGVPGQAAHCLLRRALARLLYTIPCPVANVRRWPDSAVSGIRLDRQLSEDKLPSLGPANVGRKRSVLTDVFPGSRSMLWN